MKNAIVPCMPHLLSETEIFISLLCQIFSTCYIALQIRNCLKNTSVVKVATMKNTDDFCYALKETISVQPPNQRFSLSAKMNGTGKSMKNALHILRYAKRHLSG